MLNKYCLLIVLFTVYLNSFSKTYTTKRSGPYTDSFTWQNNKGPSLNSHDTLLIQHYVELNNNLVFQSGAFVKIDSSGRLCGHYTTTVESNAYLLCFGVLQLDSLQVFGGLVDIKGKGKGVFTVSVILRILGAKMTTSDRATFAVGPWFVCQNPQRDSKVNPLSTSSLFSIAPNPSSDITNFNFDKSLLNQELCIRDINGRIIYQMNILSEKIKLDLYDWENGVYLVQVVSNARTFQQQIFVVAH